MEPTLKLDTNLLRALARDGQHRRLFDVVIGFAPSEDDALTAVLRRGTGLSRLGPRTATGAVTRDQLFEIAAQPVVKYLKLVERLAAAQG